MLVKNKVWGNTVVAVALVAWKIVFRTVNYVVLYCSTDFCHCKTRNALSQFDLFHYTMPSADLFEEDDGYEYHMRKIVESDLYKNCTYELPIAIGYNENHELVMTDLTKLPHLLVAGATGQGKSTWLHTALASLLCAKHPSELKLVLIDMSRLELNFYSIIERHYLAMLPASDYPIISDSKQVDNTLNSLCIEFDNRYDLLKAAGVRNVKEYNLKFCKRFLSLTDGHRFLPYIVIFIDEFADVIFSEGKAAEEPMTKLARLGCSVGIHMIITTKCTINIFIIIIKSTVRYGIFWQQKRCRIPLLISNISS